MVPCETVLDSIAGTGWQCLFPSYFGFSVILLAEVMNGIDVYSPWLIFNLWTEAGKLYIFYISVLSCIYILTFLCCLQVQPQTGIAGYWRCVKQETLKAAQEALRDTGGPI